MTKISSEREFNSIKVSVIMPVYKVEEYVAKAIDSIIDQKTSDGSYFRDWELIAVDDGSPDRSGEICDGYAARDERITVIHQENSGAPSARNRALDIAKGKYLMFLDSDDYCGETMLSDMYELAEKNNSQLVISGFYIETFCGLGKKTKVSKPKAGNIADTINVTNAADITGITDTDKEYLITDYIPESAVYDTKEEFRKDAYKLFDKNMLYPPWNKLYLKEYIKENKLYFPQTFWDDFPFVLSVIRDIERVSVTSRQYYHFLRARTESETQKYVPKMYEKREEEHSWMVELYKYWGLWEDEESREMVSRRYIDRLIGCFENLTNPKCELGHREKRELVGKMLESENTRFCLRYARPGSFYSKLMYLPLKWKSKGLTLLEAGVITWVKNHNMKMFARLKAGR